MLSLKKMSFQTLWYLIQSEIKLITSLNTDYIETAFYQEIPSRVLRRVYQFIKDQNFQFKSFMATYKFYNQYALKTNDGEYYLESMEDRVFFNAFTFADG